MRIDKAGKTSSPLAPASVKAPAPAAPSSGPGSFNSAANDAALALEIEEAVIGGSYRKPEDAQKEALASIDDIAARASLNIVNRKEEQSNPKQP